MPGLAEELREATHAAVLADPALQSFIEVELTEEQARRDAWMQESHRYRGVSFSGFGPGPFQGRTASDIVLAATRKKLAMEAWQSSPEGVAFRHIARAEALILTLSQTLMQAHSAYDRGLHHSANRAALARLMSEALSASQKLTQAIAATAEAGERIGEASLQAAE